MCLNQDCSQEDVYRTLLRYWYVHAGGSEYLYIYLWVFVGFCHYLEPAIWAIVRVSDKLLWLCCLGHAALSRLLTGARSPCPPLTNFSRQMNDPWDSSGSAALIVQRVTGCWLCSICYDSVEQCFSEAEMWAVGAVSADGAASWSCWPGTPTKHPSCALTSSASCSAFSHEPAFHSSFTAGYPNQMENAAVLFSHFALNSMYY